MERFLSAQYHNATDNKQRWRDSYRIYRRMTWENKLLAIEGVQRHLNACKVHDEQPKFDTVWELIFDASRGYQLWRDDCPPEAFRLPGGKPAIVEAV